MQEKTIKLPNKAHTIALWNAGIMAKAEAQAVTGKFTDRHRTATENGELHAGASKDAMKILSKGKRNELAALDHIAHLRVYLDWAEDEIRKQGHTGNLVNQAEGKEEIPAAAAAEPEAAATGGKVTDLGEARSKRGRKKADAPAAAEQPAAEQAAAEDPEEDVRPRHLKETEKQREAEKAAAAASDEEQEPELPPPPTRTPRGRKAKHPGDAETPVAGFRVLQ